MSKTDTIHMRVEPEIKVRADNILNRLGLSTTDAINIFLNQVILSGGLPFEVKLPVSNKTAFLARYEMESDQKL